MTPVITAFVFNCRTTRQITKYTIAPAHNTTLFFLSKCNNSSNKITIVTADKKTKPKIQRLLIYAKPLRAYPKNGINKNIPLKTYAILRIFLILFFLQLF